jgi:hypothetical protein
LPRRVKKSRAPFNDWLQLDRLLRMNRDQMSVPVAASTTALVLETHMTLHGLLKRMALSNVMPFNRIVSLQRATLGALALMLAAACGDDGQSSASDADAGRNCGEHGTLLRGECRCDTGYGGPTCAVFAGSNINDEADSAATEPGASACAAYCGDNGRCDCETGDCACDEGYVGFVCDVCAEGYHKSDDLCDADEYCEADSCSEHASCDDSSGRIVCECAEGYADDGCDDCAAGYHEDGESCVADTSCLDTTCNGAGTCVDASGIPECECAEGYSGARCQECATGHHSDEELCVEDETCRADSCSEHGRCNDADGVVSCHCAVGYAGDNCAACDPGLVLNAQGQCEVQCDEGEPTQFADGGFGCVAGCEPGYVGADCSACADGYHALDGECLPNAVCDSDSCSGRGTCDDSSGELVCVCNAGFLGDECEQCDSGLHPDSDGCASAGTCNANSCFAHGSCDDSGGAIECTCDEGYAGNYCEVCATDYVLDDDACVPVDVGDSCTDTTCSGHGTCDDTTGTPVCSCDATYGGIACQGCAEGFVANEAGSCVESICGDGLIDPNQGEDCDDGNAATEQCAYHANRVGCTVCNYLCKQGPGVARYCGDGVLQSARGEGCDDGEDNGQYAANLQAAHCDATCTGIGAYCGDGQIDGLFGETCDDGTDPDTGNSNSRADACRSTCQVASCGDGVVDGNEDCDDGDSDGACPDSCTEEAGALEAGAVCEQTLTHSVDTTTITHLNSVSCYDASGHSDTSYARSFSLDDESIDSYTVTQVRVGIEEASSNAATQPVWVRIYQGTGDPPTPENLTLVGSASTALAPMTNQFITVPVNATVTGGAGSYLVAEFFTPNGQGDGSFLFIGSNPNGQTGPSYLLSAPCGYPTWTPTATVGYGEMHILIHVDGFASGPICSEADAGPI